MLLGPRLAQITFRALVDIGADHAYLRPVPFPVERVTIQEAFAHVIGVAALSPDRGDKGQFLACWVGHYVFTKVDSLST